MIHGTAIGNLGADAELRFLPDSTPVLELRVASNSREKVDGEYKDVPTWLKVSLFGKRAESLGKLGLTKGTKVGVSGSIRVREYTTKAGDKGSALEMRADDVELLGAKPGGGAAGNGGGEESGGAGGIPF